MYDQVSDEATVCLGIIFSICVAFVFFWFSPEETHRRVKFPSNEKMKMKRNKNV